MRKKYDFGGSGKLTMKRGRNIPTDGQRDGLMGIADPVMRDEIEDRKMLPLSKNRVKIMILAAEMNSPWRG